MSDYMRVIWRRRGTLTAVALIVTLGGIALTGLAPEVFESEAVIHLGADSGGMYAQAPSPSRGIYAQAPSAVVAITALPFLERIAREVGVPERGRSLQRMVQAVPIGDGRLIRLRTRHGDPELSQRLNAAIARAFITRASEPVRRKREVTDAQLREVKAQQREIERFLRVTQRLLADLQTSRSRGVEHAFSRSFALNAMGAMTSEIGELHAVRLRLEQELLALEPPTVIEAADVPGEPVGAHRVRNILLSLLLGGIVGIAAAFIVDYAKSSVPVPLPETSDAVRSRSI